MELLAAISGLKALREPCEVECHTDSQYLRQGITRWVHLWKRNGWKTRHREPVKNEDLWRELDRLQGFHKVRWQWVRGHAGNTGNERCDELARQAVQAIHRRFTREALRKELAAFRASQATPEAEGEALL